MINKHLNIIWQNIIFLISLWTKTGRKLLLYILTKRTPWKKQQKNNTAILRLSFRNDHCSLQNKQKHTQTIFNKKITTNETWKWSNNYRHKLLLGTKQDKSKIDLLDKKQVHVISMKRYTITFPLRKPNIKREFYVSLKILKQIYLQDLYIQLNFLNIFTF